MFPNKVLCLQLDLANPDEVLKAAEKYKLTDRVDILINNGGMSMREEFANTDFDTCKNMMNTNCMSHIALTKGFFA